MTRTPLRISIGAGGTDLPSYYRDDGGGFVLSSAIHREMDFSFDFDGSGVLLRNA